MTDRHDAPRRGDAAPPSRPGQASPDDRRPSTAPDVDSAAGANGRGRRDIR